MPIDEIRWLYGDKAYNAKFGIFGAYKRQRLQRELPGYQEEYDRLMASIRIAVEQSFAGVSNLWEATNFKRLMKTGK